MSEPERQIMSILGEAVEYPSPSERGAFLDNACAGDADLRARVEVLLRAHEAAGNFLQGDSPSRAPVATADEARREQCGTVIGPYKLLEQIGEGGMGTVWMAQQTEPVKRLVAIKLVRAGMDSKQVLARFEAERQALALMDHPNIARVFDAGATEHGRPYFVMELVHGVPITKFCDDNHLTPHERLALFVPVCQAVQHAHQKGIIHRDIKPANVMITLCDGRPVPKVIDFGVAKATEQKLTDRTLFTQHGTLVGTLEYMSPEQAEMSPVGVDTRSDIYSLGVLLYELLTGSTPLSHQRLKEAAYAEILRLIKEEEPPRPSTRLSDSGDSLAAISAHRHMDPAKLTKLVRGELDWIAMRCLEKDRNRRYETANSLAHDIENYLHDEPVQACPPSAWYRLRKLTRRNRTALVSAATVSLVLILTLMALAANNQIIRLEQGRTQAANDRLRHNLELSLETLDTISLTVLEERLLRDSAAAQENQELLSKALGFYERFAERNEADPTVRREVANAHQRAGVLRYRLGHFDQALLALSRAGQLAVRLSEDRPADPEPKRLLADVHLLKGNLLSRGKSLEAAAREEFRQGIELLVPFRDNAALGPKYLETLASLHHSLASCLDLKPAEAEEQFRQAKALRRRLVDDAAEGATKLFYMQELASCHINLGYLLRHEFRRAQSAEELRQAIALLTQVDAQAAALPGYQRGRRLPGFSTAQPVHGALGMARANLGSTLWKMGQSRAAEREYRQVIELYSQAAQDWPAEIRLRVDLARIEKTLGSILADGSKRAEALAFYGRSIDLHRKLEAEAPEVPAIELELGAALKLSGDVLWAGGEATRATEHYREARALWEKLLAPYPDVPDYAHELAVLLGTCDDPQIRDPARALVLAQRLVAQYPEKGDYWGTLGEVQYRQGLWQAAVVSLKKSNRLHHEQDPGDWLFLAMVHWQLGEKQAARDCYDRAVELLRVHEYPPREESRSRAEAAALLSIKPETPKKAHQSGAN